ncbi:GNAT family N-acetyltransferase [Micromonospora sp. LOL_015]|uniref:GNAT family N-acetyltransferase n=2 Tax=unclassified Micromonospora TaxID=2617518 RepID=UPI003A895239
MMIRSIVVEHYDDPRAASRAGWDAVAGSGDTPVFYQDGYLSAYHDAPLAPLERLGYLVAREPAGRPVAVLPIALHRLADPIGGLRRLHPGIERDSALLSHVWHCYDTQLLGAVTRTDVVTELLDTLRRLADDWRARWYGLVNVDSSGPTAAALTAAGLTGRHLVDRYSTDLTGLTSYEDYLARLAPRPRANLRRNERRAIDAGFVCDVTTPDGADLVEIAELCDRTAARFGNAGFYPTETFTRFVTALGPAAHVLRIRQRGTLVAAGVCLTDQHRFHTWTCGVEYRVDGNASPYAALFTESVRLALRLGRPILEGGRSNDIFKRRHGLTARRLDAYVMRL